jgi:hypothetical protein
MAADNPVPACWGNMRAAWVCDDAGVAFQECATNCRKAAIQALDAIHTQGLTLCPDRETDEILRLDLLRRAGEFQAVVDASGHLKSGALSDILARIAAFQAEQAAQKVTACFTVEDALGR